MHPWKNFKIISYFLLSTLLFLIGIILIAYSNTFFKVIVKQAFVLKPDSKVFNMWRKNPLPLKMDFYFFNWTNPEDINNSSVKPKFEQVGPYRFIETKEKINITWNKNDSVTFNQLRYWYFDEKSPRNLTDRVTSLNAVSLAAATKVRNWSYLVKKGFSVTLSSVSPTLKVTKTINEFLFEGFEDPLMKMAQSMPFLANEGIPQFEKFCWFYGRNGSFEFDGIFNMATGQRNQLGEFIHWNYKNRTNFFQGNCGKVHGSAGELFPPAERRSQISLFSTDMCQNMPLEYTEDESIHEVQGRKYTVGRGLLDNGTLIPENLCFCNGECVKSGLVNVSACRYGTPAFMSLPNFYAADPFYLNQVEGMRPKKDLHEFFITLEPQTGIPLKVAARLQLNLLLRPVKNVLLFEHVPETFFPVLWFEQTAVLSKDLAFELKILLNLTTIFLVIASCFIISSLALFLRILYLVKFKSENALIHRVKPIDIILDSMYSR